MKGTFGFRFAFWSPAQRPITHHGTLLKLCGAFLEHSTSPENPKPPRYRILVRAQRRAVGSGKPERRLRLRRIGGPGFGPGFGGFRGAFRIYFGYVCMYIYIYIYTYIYIYI